MGCVHSYGRPEQSKLQLNQLEVILNSKKKNNKSDATFGTMVTIEWFIGTWPIDDD